MRIVFMGTGEIALPCLRALLASQHEVCAVVTQPDRPVGRHQEMHPPGPKVMAQEAGIPVLQPEKLSNAEDLAELAAFAPELIVVMAYGQILSMDVIELPTVGCINVHASLLPRHRGASCIQAAIADGDEESGVTIMHVVKKLDAGDVILRKRVSIGAGETGGDLHDRLAELSPPVLLEAMEGLEAGTSEREVQDEALSTYAPKLLRADGKIDWSVSAAELSRRIRAYDPWPGTFAVFKDGKGRERRLKIYPGTEAVEVAGGPGAVRVEEDGVVVCCGEGGLRLSSVQPEGGRRMTVAEFVVGHGFGDGGQLF
ncbi:MAG: methionyl-tRNA formyltransferase [Akkermansiaceae bacterium]|nr:methionyl-tRNA formyltransferase [Akkermansiaceae bacterium]